MSGAGLGVAFVLGAMTAVAVVVAALIWRAVETRPAKLGAGVAAGDGDGPGPSRPATFAAARRTSEAPVGRDEAGGGR